MSNHQYKCISMNRIKLTILWTLCFLGSVSAQNNPQFYAYHTERNASAIFGIYSDIVVNLPTGQFIFERNQGFRPYWQNTSNQVAYLGPANPDTNVEYSYARVIAQNDSQIVVHWRYPTTTNNVTLGFETYVHELYTIRPSGSITRVVKQGTPRLEDWQFPGNQYSQELQVTSGGMTIVSTTNPTTLPRPLVAKTSNPVKGPVVSSPLHHWKFDEAITTYNDSTTIESVTNSNSIIHGYQANYKSGVSGTSLAFDGYFSNVTLPAASATSAITRDITLEAWVSLSANPHNMVPLVQQSAFGLIPTIGGGDDEKPTPFQGGQGYYLGINFEGQPSLVVSVGGTLYYCTAPTGTVPLNQWTHIVGVRFDDQLFLYVNGVLVSSADAPLNTFISTTTNTDIGIGLNNVRMLAADASPTGSPLGNGINYFGLEGMIDEVRIYNSPLSATQIVNSYNNFNPGTTIANNPPIEKRVLPADTTLSNTFSANYTKLKYHDLWDNMWQTTDFPDISVKFENSQNSVVFWRGMSYGFALVSENNIWNGGQSVENEILTPQTFTYEHMMDKECRTSHVRLIEDTPARKLVHWRYAPRAPDFSIYPTAGENYWVDEYYYIFPDEAVVQQVDWHGQPPLPFHDNNLIISPGKDVDDLMDTVNMVQFANDSGQKGMINYPSGGGPGISQATIKLMNTKSVNKPYNLYPGNAFHNTVTYAGPFSHWPVSQVNSIGVGATTPDTKHRARSVSFGGNDHMGEGGEPYTCFWGLTNQPIDSLVKLRKSWNSAPLPININGGTSQGYDLLSRTYKFNRNSNSDSLVFDIAASTNQPISNLCIEIANWGDLNSAQLVVNDDNVSNFKQGIIRGTDGMPALVIFHTFKTSSGVNSFAIRKVPNAVQVSAKVFLEGPFSSGQMSDNLRSGNLIPLTEPYTALANFSHVNGGNESVAASVLNTTGNNAIVDWVFLELRNATNNTIVEHTRSALLQKDGDIVDLDATSPVSFANVNAGNYFITVRHRNHLSIMTNSALALSSTSTSIDFTTSTTTTFGNNARKNLGNNVLGMYAADLNASGIIDASDRNQAWNDRTLTGYLSSDADMNGVTAESDRVTVWNNRNLVQQLP